MSIRLRELIRAVRACKTAADEREVIAKESAALREAFRDPDYNEYRHRNVAKLMYIHMLGYPTHFGQMETMKLIAANGFADKRMGYLGLMILLDERQEVLMLVTNSIKMDMTNTKHPYIAGLALAALGNICSAEMGRDLAPDLERLMADPRSPAYLRKKAALCAVRVVKKVPDLVEQFAERAATLLSSADGALQLAGVSLMLQIVEQEPVCVELYRPHVHVLCTIQRKLMGTGNSSEYDVSGTSNPFLMVKILRLLRHLGRGNVETSDAMSDVLAQVASNIDATRNAGNAVLYECVQTIMGVESMVGLRVLAVNTLGKFLQNKDNNMRYVALNTLAKVVTVDNNAVQRHRATIVECVKDADVSIRRRALELVYGLVNEANIKNLTKELIDYLAVSDVEFKPDLTSKICTLIQRFAPDKRWHIDNLVQLLTQAGAHVKDEVCRALVVLITNAPELHGYAVRTLYRNLHAYQDVAERSLLLTALWCIGEFGEMLVAGAGGTLLEGEPAVSVSDKDVVDLLAVIVLRKQVDPLIKEVGLTAAMKLTARLPGQVQRLQTLVSKHLKSAALEVQSRSAEYSRMFTLEPGVRSNLLERMPALDEAEYLTHLGIEPRTSASSEAASAAAVPVIQPPGVGAASTVPAVSAAQQNGHAAKSPIDLLGDLDLGVPSASQQQAGANALQDLLAAPGGMPGPQVPGLPGAGGAADLLDLLSTPPPQEHTATAVGAGSSSGGAAQLQWPSVLAYSSSAGYSIHFTFSREGPIVNVHATYSNAGPAPITGFQVQVAVPKYMTMQIEPATGTELPAAGGGALQQRVQLTNSMQGVKPTALRLRITFTNASGQQVTEQATFDQFPAGL